MLAVAIALLLALLTAFGEDLIKPRAPHEQEGWAIPISVPISFPDSHQRKPLRDILLKWKRRPSRGARPWYGLDYDEYTWL